MVSWGESENLVSHEKDSFLSGSDLGAYFVLYGRVALLDSNPMIRDLCISRTTQTIFQRGLALARTVRSMSIATGVQGCVLGMKR